MNYELPALLVQAVGRLIKLVCLFSGGDTDSGQCLSDFQEVIRLTQRDLKHHRRSPLDRRFVDLSARLRLYFLIFHLCRF